MNNRHFVPFPIGKVQVRPAVTKESRIKKSGRMTLHYPIRLEAMALDPSKVAEEKTRIYSAGQIDFTVKLFRHVTIEITPKKNAITLSERTGRRSLVMHAALIMKEVLGFDDGLSIDIREDVSLRHCGLGSSSGTIAAVAATINELFSCPIAPLELSRFCAQNHGEEIDNDKNHLVPVQCIGGSAVCGNFDGGLTILAGEATPIMSINLPENLKVVVGVPNDYTFPDSEELMQKEQENMSGFVTSGEHYGKQIAYRLVHEVMPSLVQGNLKPCKDLIFDYRWDMGSIKNCSFVLPRITTIAESLRPLKDDDSIAIIALSSVGPGFFAITSKPKRIVKLFEGLNMSTMTTSVHNGKYIVGEEL